ncbi:inhibin beta E subunit [Chelydra serpentina]|uniref:Inhibin beta E subunit n=1 Tax=Chelydra serpentina TaxID=8475 RepID=A0A8T1S2E4_CHESE|nr:inhibin beta E subunit [Chelydra serpentina]
MPTLEPGTERRFLLELAKRQILEKLQLSERPNVTQPVPRGAVANALRRLHVGKGRRDGQPGPFARWDGPDADELGYEIISFAKTEISSPSSLGLRFRFSRGTGRDVHILQAQLWLYLRPPRSGQPPVTLRVSRAGALLGERQLEARAGGWQSFTLLPTAQKERTLRLELECRGCQANATAGSDAGGSHQPFLVAKATAREPGRRVAKRSLRCDQTSTLCCRKDYYVDFRDIGWNDWIIKPEGYQINYCMGQCSPHVASSPGMAASSHTAVLSLIRAHNVRTGGQSCCVPTHRRPLSILYFDRNSNIVKTDIPDMIVDACGCS